MLRRKRALGIVVLVAGLAAGGAYYYHTTTRSSPTTQPQSSVRTTRAFRGELVISATGAGTVIPASEMDLGFPSSGTLIEVNVQVGDTVRTGDVLARIDDLEARRALSSAEAQVSNARLQLTTARKNHQALVDGAGEAERLQAEAALKAAEARLADLRAGPDPAEVAAAEAALAQARESYQQLLNGPTALELEQRELQLAQAKNGLWSAQMGRDARGNEKDKNSGAYDQAQVSVLNAEISVRLAEMNLAQLHEPASAVALQNARAQVTTSEAKLAALRAGPSESDSALAEAELILAKDRLQELVRGASDDDLATSEEQVRQAELSLAQAELALEAAQRNVTGTALVAPYDGTVMAVAAQVGESAGGSALITLAKAGLPQLEVYLDETDMDRIAVGYEAEVVLDAKPDQTFAGRVMQVSPSLVTTGGVRAVRALVELSPESFAKPQGLLMGMAATVDVIGGRAENAVLVPVEALRELDAGEYAVFVMENGELRLRMVEVGLMDLTFAEIRSGLQVGEMVSTGMVETR